MTMSVISLVICIRYQNILVKKLKILLLRNKQKEHHDNKKLKLCGKGINYLKNDVFLKLQKLKS